MSVLSVPVAVLAISVVTSPLAPPWCAAGASALAEEVLEQVISRENPLFKCSSASLTVGRDGMVYLSSAGHDTGFALRMSREGKDRFGGRIVYALGNVTANADGVVASSNGHFAHKVTIYDARFEQTAEFADFRVGDDVGWDAPSHVEAGASGDFYGIDRHRNRILRISPKGKLVQSFAIPPDSSGGGCFRVCEKKQALYVRAKNGSIRCVGFDGKTRWEQPADLDGQWYLQSQAFDVDDDGILCILERRSDTVKRFSADGQALAPVRLAIGDRAPPQQRVGFFALRVWKDDVIIRSEHDTELFQRYDLRTGEFRQSVSIEYERLKVRLPGLVWKAGESVPFKVSFESASGAIRPRWRVWLRPFETAEYRELALTESLLKVPDDCAGLHVLKVTPETEPLQKGSASEYMVRAFVEVRKAGARGSVTVVTPQARVHFGRGEAIPFSVIARSPGKEETVQAAVLLSDGTRTLAEGRAELKTNGAEATFVLPPWLTSSLLPGRYAIEAKAPGFTCVPQALVIGPGLSSATFFRVLYGDYSPEYPSAGVWDFPEVVASHVARCDKLGFNLIVDRIGSHLQVGNLDWQGSDREALSALAKRLESDPAAVSPAKVHVASPLVQTVSAYGAAGIRQMAILMNNDAGLPLGTGFDGRKQDELLKTLARVTETLKPEPSFRGWSWSSNWWVFDRRGSSAARTPDEKGAYEAALRRAKETGAWDPVLDTVSGYRLGLAVEAQALFNESLRRLAPGLVTAVAAPYRNVESYPPITFSNVDEVDLHIQWEQIEVPFTEPFNVDFYRRPGRRAWAHPEVWNDDGTGGQILSHLFQAAMRGADGVGCSGDVPPWSGHGGGLPDDPRIAHYGNASIWRALNGFLARYGPWLATLENDDPVAIAASGRMFKIDEWKHVTGLHFARVLEAYISCLAAGRPASVVFAEDVKPDSFRRFRAVLVVDQRVQMEPAMRGALAAAKKAGTAVFYDGTCRAELVSEFEPLGLSFDKLENDPSPAGDDSAYWRFAGYARANLPALRAALDPVAPPVAGVDNEEVLLTRRKAGAARYYFAVNGTIPKLEPGQIWRMNLGITSRVPLKTPLRIAGPAGAVYDVLALRRLPQGGAFQADLRSCPARIYAVLPAEIARIVLRAPRAARASESFAWSVEVQDASGKPIDASIPIEVRLAGPRGATIDERFAAAGPKGASGTLIAPLNAPAEGLMIEAAELFGGKSASLAISVSAPARPIGFEARPATIEAAGALASRTREGALAPAVEARGDRPAAWLEPEESAFGPHVRDLVVVDGGSLAVMNTMNWDHNLYAVDTESGKLRWRARAGHYFAFAPQPLDRGVAIQGFDFRSAEGYHLYLVDPHGTFERRFALYGLPKRLPHRFVPGILKDRINSFAVPSDGSWIASAGDLGVAVWDRSGRLLWSEDWWRQPRAPGKRERRSATLAAPDARTLLLVEGMRLTAVAPATGKPLWRLDLAPEGEVTKVAATRDGKTCALMSTASGGRVFLVKEGRLAGAFATAANDLDLSPEGAALAVADANLLKLYSSSGGLQWIFGGDDRLRFPRFSPDGRRIATTSDIGTAYVLGLDGRPLLEKDLGARGVPAWLPGGDLVLATWMGRVTRLDAQYREKWRTKLDPEAEDMTGKLLADDGAPTARVSAWGNAEKVSAQAAPNVLAGLPLVTRFVPTGDWGGRAELARDPKTLYDGKADPPEGPWLGWNYVGFFAETSPFNYLLIDAFRTQLRVRGVTFFEDPAHPESWLRDVDLEYWDPAREEWTLVAALLSDAPVHTHMFPRPVEAARFRIVFPWGLVGNFRLAEIVFHGERLGCSHPDAAASRPVAVLFDEQDDIRQSMIYGDNGVSFQFEGAYSGGRCLAIRGEAGAGPIWQPPFGHAVPNWDFEIVETPQPGQYRYLQFAWKAASAKTKGITLSLGGEGGSVKLCAGEARRLSDTDPQPVKVEELPPRDWKVERVDLWQIVKRPFRVQALGLGASGDGALFDRILLGRSEKDFGGSRGDSERR